MMNSIYKIKSTKSSIITNIQWEGLDKIAESMKNGYIVSWQHHGVFTACFEDRQIRWLSDLPENEEFHIVRLRAFNENEEYHFWRSGQMIRGRHRSDTIGVDTEYIDTSMVLRSVVGKVLIQSDYSEGTMAVLTRNYIGYHNETAQAGYVDTRFVKFEQFK